MIIINDVQTLQTVISPVNHVVSIPHRPLLLLVPPLLAPGVLVNNNDLRFRTALTPCEHRLNPR